MLGDFDTGYEGKFDLPLRETPPDRPYLLATLPRTGSTWFSHLLWRTGCLGAPLEYLNFDAAGPYGFANRSAEGQARLWRSVLRRRTSPNGVFGLKCFPVQLQQLEEANPALLADLFATMLPRAAPKRVIHLGRRDRVAHAVSYARATLSGVWRQEQEQGAPAEAPEYSAEALAGAERWIDSQAEAWEQMYGELGIVPLRIWYEDALAAPDQAIAEVADWLGVRLDPAAAVAVPEIRRQSGEGAEEWIRRRSVG